MPKLPIVEVEIGELRAEIGRLNKIISALMDRAECSTAAQGSDFSLFQTAIVLEDQVRSRTAELESALRENERITRALRHGEEKLRTLIEAIPDAIQFKDAEGRWLEFNAAARRLFGLGDAPCYGMTDLELSGLVPSGYKDALLRSHGTDEAVWRDGKLSRIERVVSHADGRKLTYDVLMKPLFAEDGTRKAMITVGRDVTEIRQAAEALRITASVFDNSQEAILITDANNLITDVNPAFTRITGYGREEAIGKSPKMLSSGQQGKEFYAALWKSLAEKKSWRGEIWNRRKSGEIYAELLSIAVICDDDGRVQRHVAVFSDISYLKENEAQLNRIANYDALTAVPNRRLLYDRLQQAIAHARRSGMMLAVCYIDLDGFKQVNDRYGHEAGDALLVEVTRRLQASLRADDTLARLGGDEFVILFCDLARQQECFRALDRILDAIVLPVPVGDGTAAVSASIGVTFYPADDTDGEGLLRHADQAMYVAKQAGKNCYRVYEPAPDDR